VTLTDDGTGTLVPSYDYGAGHDNASFVNEYTASGNAALQVVKTMEGERTLAQATDYAYTAVEIPPREAVDLVFDVIGCLEEHGVPLPDFELVRGFSFSEFHGWGIQISPEGLSRVI
jgi:hypothetical protein